jgi:hypothetical protein
MTRILKLLPSLTWKLLSYDRFHSPSRYDSFEEQYRGSPIHKYHKHALRKGLSRGWPHGLLRIGSDNQPARRHTIDIPMPDHDYTDALTTPVPPLLASVRLGWNRQHLPSH